MKKLLFFLISILLPIIVEAYDFEANGFYFNILSMEDLTVEITSGDNKYEGDIIIPSSIVFSGRELSVIKVGDNAFRNCYNVTSVVFSNTISTIGDYAFSGCYIKELTIPESIIYIGGKSFFACPNLKKLVILDDEKDIEINWNSYLDRPFTGCPIEYIYIGRNIKRESWGSASSVFDGLTSEILNIEIGEKVEQITYWQFQNCKIASIIIPKNVKGIKGSAFYNCSLLEEVKMSDNIQEISESAFNGCSSLTSIVLPKSLEIIGESAFANCSKLLEVTNNSPVPLSINDNCFSAITYWTGKLIVPFSTSSDYKNANGWKNFSNIVEDKANNPTYHLYYILDGEEYKNFEIEYGASIIPETAPTKEGYTFSGWNEIPETMPAHDVTITGVFTKNPPQEKCATPTIAFKDGKLMFECETEDVEYVSEVTVADNKMNYSNEVSLTGIYKVSVYATKAGYENSDIVTKEIDVRGLMGDMNDDGSLSVTDVTILIDKILKQK